MALVVAPGVPVLTPRDRRASEKAGQRQTVVAPLIRRMLASGEPARKVASPADSRSRNPHRDAQLLQVLLERLAPELRRRASKKACTSRSSSGVARPITPPPAAGAQPSDTAAPIVSQWS